MSATHHYCTYFDHRYLPRALALYQSLCTHDGDFLLWALCFDDQTYQRLRVMGLPHLRPIALEEFLYGDEELAAVRGNRSIVEFYFTCSPSLPAFVFKNAPEVQQVTYLDSDLYFFQDPTPVFDEIGSASIAIIPHRFPNSLRHLEKTGVFNVGWLTFRRDEEALACLGRWRSQCLDWCFDQVEGTRYADQGYLTQWPEQFANLIILKHKGANLAPWNVRNYDLRVQDGRVCVDEDPLVFFHFQSLARLVPQIYKINFRRYRSRPTQLVKRHIYYPYLKELERIYSNEKIDQKDERLRWAGDMSYLFLFQRGMPLLSMLKYNVGVLRDRLNGDFLFMKDFKDD